MISKCLILTAILATSLAAQGGTQFAGSRTMAAGNTMDLSAAGVTKTVRVVNADSTGACSTLGALTLNPAAGRLFECDGTNWIKIGDKDGLGGGVSSFATRTGAITPAVGDYSSFYASLTGAYSNPSWLTGLAVSKLLQGGATVGQVLKWDGTNWVPSADSTCNPGEGLILLGVLCTVDPTVTTKFSALQAGDALSCRPASASGTAYTCTLSPVVPTNPFKNGSRLYFRPDVASGNAPTLNVNPGTGAGATGVIPLRRADGSAAIATNDLGAGVPYTIELDTVGGYWRVLNVPSGASGGGTVTTFSAVNPSFTVNNPTTTPSLYLDELRLAETSGHVNICGYRNDLIGPGTSYGNHGIHLDSLNTTNASGYTVQTNSAPCEVQLTTGATSGNVVGLSQNGSSLQLYFSVGSLGWRYDTFVVTGSSVSNVNYHVGLTQTRGLNPTRCPGTGNNCAALILDTSIGSTWRLRTCVAGACGTVDTGVTAVASTLYRLSLYEATNGTISAQVNGSTPVTRAGPTASLGPGIYAETLTTGTRRIDFRGYAFYGAMRLQ